MLEGPHKGAKARVLNPLSGKLEFDEIYKAGDRILVEYKIHQDRIHLAFTRGYYRLTHAVILIALFIIFMNFMGQGMRVPQIFNLNFVAAEVLNLFVGSFGLVAVAPLTAFIGAMLYGQKKMKSYCALFPNRDGMGTHQY